MDFQSGHRGPTQSKLATYTSDAPHSDRISCRKTIFLYLFMNGGEYRFCFLKSAPVSTLKRSSVARPMHAAICKFNGEKRVSLVSIRTKYPFQKDGCLTVPLHELRAGTRQPL